MKKILIPFLLFAGIVGYMSCQKEHSSDPNSVKSAKTEDIKKGEPVQFSVNNLTGEAAKWSVSPSTNVRLTSDGNNATVYFGKAGTYSVIALTGALTSRVMVTVCDSSYNDSTCHHCDSIPRDSIPRDSIPRDSTHYGHDSLYSLFGDQLHLTPSRVDTGSRSGLAIAAVTENTYPCLNNTLITYVTNSIDSGYVVHYTNVWVPWNCSGGQIQARSTRVIFPIQDGNHLITVVKGNIAYTGSFTKTGTQYSFNWPYNSGVTISPKTIN